MQGNNFWFLENIDVTGILCPNKIGDESHGNVKHKKYKKGEYIYLANEQSDKVFFIREGRVKIGHYGEGNKEVTKAILTVGEVFGEMSIIGQEKRRDFATALEDTALCEVPKSDLNNLMRDHGPIAAFFMNLLGSRALQMEKRLESLVFKDSRTRIIDFLVDLVERRGDRVGFEHVVRRFLTHQEIANLTATSRQTVTTVLNDLKKSNLITFNRRRLLVRDLDKLKAS